MEGAWTGVDVEVVVNEKPVVIKVAFTKVAMSSLKGLRRKPPAGWEGPEATTMASALNSVNVIFDMVFKSKSHKINNKTRYLYGRNHSRRTACACLCTLAAERKSRVVRDVMDVVWMVRMCVIACVCESYG